MKGLALLAVAPCLMGQGADGGIERARSTTLEFTARLPDFVCLQSVTRYESLGGSKIEWRRLDRAEVRVAYRGSREWYTPTGRGTRPDRTGTWSTGEYAGILREVFATGARFARDADEDLDGRAASRWTFEVDQRRSRWKVEIDGWSIRPRHTGRLWVDRATHRVLRVEIKAVDPPRGYPLDVMEMTVDYGPVAIGAGEYLLPVRAANLSCRRGTLRCWRNEIEFGDYRKFEAESTVTFRK